MALLATGCGRSAPEGAAGTDDGTEDGPTSAGIQVATDSPVIVPIPTSVTVATAPAEAGPEAGMYVVEPGDTLSVIAEELQVSIEALSQANGITDPDTITPGQELIVPAG